MNEFETIKTELRKNGYSEDIIDWKIKNNKFLTINEDIFIFDGKPSIDKILYYDDEYTAIEITLENFMKYNLRLNFKSELVDDYNDYYIIKNTDKIYSYGKINSAYTTGRIYRDMTKDEMNQINEFVIQLKKAYEKRLNTYWKKYQSKIYASGYWANRQQNAIG